MKVLIATATAGAGHLQAAMALEEAWKRLRPRDILKLVDTLEFTPRLYRKAYAEGYVRIAEKTPELYAHAFRKTDDPVLVKKMTRWRRLTARVVARGFIRLVDDWKPDLVLCPHFLPMETLGSVRGRPGHHQPRIVTVVTDFEAHALWMEPCVDLYAVAMHETKARLIARGVPAQKVVVTGIPVSERFVKPIPIRNVRRIYKLRSGKPVLLVLGGGLGMGPLAETLAEIDKVPRDIQVLVVAGRNEKLRQTLLGKRYRQHVQVLGFVTNMEELMSVSDLIITKPGGLTSSEALALGKPLLIVNPLPGQEAANSDFLLERGAAAKINRLEDLPSRLEALLRPSKVKRMAQAAKRIGRPKAARDVCKAVLSHLLFLVGFIGMGSVVYGACSLSPKDQVTLFPTAAWTTDGGKSWQADIHAWIYEPEGNSRIRRTIVAAIANELKLPPGTPDHDVFKQRVSLFQVDVQPGRTLTLQMGSQNVELPASDSLGHSRDTVSLASSAVALAVNGWVPLDMEGCAGQAASAQVQLIPPKGLTVISDIDDTMKISNVLDRSALLTSTFLKPFVPVPGMPEAFRELERQGAVFHYVSSSPWQLFPALSEFIQGAGFPRGTFYLKRFRPKSKTALSLWAKPDAHKRPVIEELLAHYPHREFVLIGDSSERDPEIFGDLARRYGSQIRLVAIRNVHQDGGSDARFRHAFRELPDHRWVTFNDASRIAPALQASSHVSRSEIVLGAKDRVLILSPHPDDDILGCAGVIQSAVSKGVPLKVVYLTNGDNYEWAFMAYKKRPVLRPETVRAMGQLRRGEAIAAEQLLGVPEKDLIFLGYPDWGTEHIFMEHWGEQRPEFRSMLTKVSAVPYENAYRPGASYKGESVLADLKAIMLDFKPTQVFVSHPIDTHRDHRTYYLFAQIALWDLGDQLKSTLYPYLVHFPFWPEPRGLVPHRRLMSPLGFHDLWWAEQELSPEETDRKRSALALHRTQMALDHRYLYSFVAANELFSRFEDIQPGGTIQTTGESLQPRELEISPSVSTAPVAEMGWRMIYREGSNLVFRMELSKRTLVRHGVRMYAFGYRHDRRFEDMPKLKFHIRGRQVKVYDQGRPLEDTGVLLERDQRSLMLRVPLTLLGDPEKIIGTAWSRSAEEPFDMRIWRVLDLGLRPGL